MTKPTAGPWCFVYNRPRAYNIQDTRSYLQNTTTTGERFNNYPRNIDSFKGIMDNYHNTGKSLFKIISEPICKYIHPTKLLNINNNNNADGDEDDNDDDKK